MALVGLALAFASALFSTVSRKSGDLWATLILASAALILATMVGLTTVPYLARRVAAERLRNAVDYDVTRVGLVYVLLTLVIGIAALNTGNNLLYIVVATLLAAILVSGIASAVVLRELELDVRVPEHVFTRQPVMGHIVLHNPRRWLPALSIHVLPSKRPVPGKRWVWEPTVFGFPEKRPPERQWLRLPDRQLRRVPRSPQPQGFFEGSAYFPYLGPGDERIADLELRFPHRGRYLEGSFGLATRFPFAFLTKTRRLALLRSVLVYPPVEATDEFLEILPMITGELETFVRGRGYDLYRIREHMPEDSARHVDWKATAKSGSLKVREFSREDERRFQLVFDNPAPGVLAAEGYERAVALAASLAWHFSLENADISFLAPGYQGSSDVYAFLGFLALIEPQVAASVIDTLVPSGDYHIVLTTRSRGSIPSALWNCSYIIFLADRAGHAAERAPALRKLSRPR
ncbi:MAG TPA: DUF58 domain-containing protein [Terriglobales bacterium]|nr:DUF58 domain-containing protein [Terriglobales bacterium]